MASFLNYWPPPDASVDTLSRFRPTEPFGIEFDRAINLETTPDVSLTDIDGNPIAFTSYTNDGRTQLIRVDPGSRSRSMQIALPGKYFGNSDTTFTHLFVPYQESDLGELSGVALSRSGFDVIVELAGEELRPEENVIAVDSTGVFSFGSLPAGNYQLRIIADKNGNGRWDGGSFDPFATAEPLTWSADTLSVRPRFDSVIPDTLFAQE